MRSPILLDCGRPPTVAQSPSVMNGSLITPARLRFALGLLLGVAAGLAYGWLINPVEFVETSPDALSRDYRTDYVLMVAEAYSGDEDLPLAQRRLGALGPLAPTEIVAAAIEYARSNRFAGPDLARLENLESALTTRGPTPEIGGP